jgi:hypothetical protein
MIHSRKTQKTHYFLLSAWCHRKKEKRGKFPQKDTQTLRRTDSRLKYLRRKMHEIMKGKNFWIMWLPLTFAPSILLPMKHPRRPRDKWQNHQCQKEVVACFTLNLQKFWTSIAGRFLTKWWFLHGHSWSAVVCFNTDWTSRAWSH